MAPAWRLATIMALAVIVLTAHPARAAPMEPATAPVPAVEAEFVVERVTDAGREILRIDGRWRLRVAAQEPSVAAVMRAHADSDEQDRALRDLLDAVGVSTGFSPRDVTVSVAKGVAVVSWRDDRSLYDLEGLRRWNPRDKIEAGSYPDILRAGDDLRVQIGGLTSDKPIDWRVRVLVRQGKVVALAPLPESYGAQDGTWHFRVSDKPASLRVQFTLEPDLRRALSMESRLWAISRWISYFIGSSVVLLLFVWWATSRRSPAGTRPARRAAVIGVLLAFASLVCALVNVRGVSAFRSSGQPVIVASLFTLGAFVPPLLAAAALVATGRQKLQKWWDRPTAIVVGGVLALAVAVAVFSALRTYDDPNTGLFNHHGARWVLAGGAVALTWALCALLLWGLWLVLAPHWPGTWRLKWRPQWLPGWTKPRLLEIALIIVVTAVVAQWVLSLHHRVSTFASARDQPAWWEYLPSEVRFMPLNVLSRLDSLWPVITAILLMAYVSTFTKGWGAAAFSLRSWPVRAFIVFFCGIVIGTEGTLVRGQVPLAFLFGFLLIRFGALRLPGGRMHARPLSRDSRIELLTVALEREDLRRRLETEHAKLTAGELKLDAYAHERDRLLGAIRRRDRGGSESLAFGLGPDDNLSENAWVAMRVGAWLSIVPLAYYLWVLITSRADIAFSGQDAFGGLGLLVGLLQEASFWLAMAFLFGGLYPYIRGRVGVVKGSCLGAVFALSTGLAHGILHMPGSTWTFRALQVVVFLAVLGYFLDRRTIVKHEFATPDLLDLYRARDFRFVVGYASPLVLALIGIFQQLLSGQASEAVTKIVEAAPSALPLIP